MANTTRRRASRSWGNATARFQAEARTSLRSLTADVGPVVYAARLDDGTIKIGHTADVYNRMAKFGGMSNLVALKPGTYADEQQIHKLLVEHRARGNEYYRPTPEVIGVVNEMRAAYGLPPLEN